MPVQIGSLFVSFEANTGPMTAAVQRATGDVSKATASIRRDAGLTERAVGNLGNSFNSKIRPYQLLSASRAFETLSDRASLLRSVLLSATTIFGGFTAALSSNIILRYADSYTGLSNQIRVTTKEHSDLVATMSAVKATADDTRSSLSATATLYSRLAKAAPERSAQEIIGYVQTIQKALQLGGATAQEATSAAIQFSQAIASDKLGGEELRAVLETPLGLALAKGLGVTIGKLREMSIAGKLTADVVLGSLSNIKGYVDKEFARSVVTLDQALTVVDSALTESIGKFNEAHGATRLLAGGILGIAKNSDTLVNTLALAGAGIGALFAGRALGKGAASLTGIGRRDNERSGIAGFFTDLREKSAKAKKDIADLEQQLTNLKSARLSASLDANRARRGAEGDLFGLAPKSFQNEVNRALFQVDKIAERQLANNEKIKKSNDQLAAISAALPARTVAAVQRQTDAEIKLNDLYQQRGKIIKDLASIQGGISYFQSSGDMKGVSKYMKAYAETQQQLVATENKIYAQRDTVAKHAATVQAQTDKAQQASVEKRITLLRGINDTMLQNSKLEEERDGVLLRGKNAITEAERAGAGVAAKNVGDTAANLRSLTTQTVGAEQALSTLRQSMGIVPKTVSLAKAAISGFLGIFGGPWGFALTSAIAAVGYFADRAAAAAAKTAAAKKVIDDAVARSGQGEGKKADVAKDSQDASVLQAKLAELRKEVKDARDEAITAGRSLTGLLGRAGAGEAAAIGKDILPMLNTLGQATGPVTEQIRSLVGQFLDGSVKSVDFRDQVGSLAAKLPISAAAQKEFADKVADTAEALRHASIGVVQLTDDIDILQKTQGKAPPRTFREAEDKGAASLAKIDTTQAALEDARRNLAVSELKAKGLNAEAKALQYVQTQREKGNYVSYAAILPIFKQIEANDKLAESLKKSNTQFDKTANIIDKIKRQGEAAFLSDIDRQVVESAKNIQGAEKKVRDYIAAVNSGNLSKAPKELIDIRQAQVLAEAGQAYRGILQQYGTGSQLTQQFADKQAQLNYLVNTGMITANQASSAWANFVTSFGQYGWINDVGSAFGDFAKSAVTDFSNIGDAANAFLLRLRDIAIQVLLIEPLVQGLKNSLSSVVGGNGFNLASAFGFGGTAAGFGTATAGTAAGTSVAGDLLGFVMHGGGTVGSGGTPRMMPASLFAGAPRLHNGLLGPGEFPAVLQDGERVIPKDMVGASVTDPLHVTYAPVYNVQGSGPELDELRRKMAQDKQEFPAEVAKVYDNLRSRRVRT